MFSRRGIRRVVWTLALALTGGAFAQRPLSQNALKIERHVAQLAPDAKISVIPYQGREAFGRFASKTADGFTFHDVDTTVDVTTKYEEVKILRNGYGGYNMSHRHTDPKKVRITRIVLAGALVGLLILAAVSLSHS